MAQRGSNKELSVRQEDYVARLFDGKRSRSSGAAAHDAGDVRCKQLLIECKMTMSPTTPKFITQMEKIAEEAWEEGKDPVLALRYYSPHSVIAGPDGWIDVTVMLATDHAAREEVYGNQV